MNEQTKPQLERNLYPKTEIIEIGFIQVSKLHSLYWEVYGNPNGLPAILIHGGPGTGSRPSFVRIFDPTIYKIFQIDLRGSAKSLPRGCIEENSIYHIISDIEVFRVYSKVEIWHTVYAGS
jgi:proline iminopeptidase